MKKILLPLLSSMLLFFALQNNITAKPKEKENKEKIRLLEQNKEGEATKYEEVFTYDSVTISQETAYKRAKEFIISTLKTGDNNIVNDDPAFSQLINNGSLLLKSTSGFGYAATNTSFDFKLKIYFKNGRYKVIIDNVVFHTVYNTSTSVTPVSEPYERLRNNKAGNKIKDEIDEDLTSLITNLNKSVKNKSTEANSNW